jgi:aminoglycoside 6'-N-acetyltransferase
MTVLHGDGFLLRPIEPADGAELRRIRGTPEVAEWWHPTEDDFPFADEPDMVRFAIVAGDAIAGLIQYGEETDPTYRNAWLDIFVDPAQRGRGLGPAAIRVLCRHLADDRGHHHFLIDPATANTAAIRAYEKAGFKRVGVMRQAERDVGGDGWHDSLLMDLLAEEL